MCKNIIYTRDLNLFQGTNYSQKFFTVRKRDEKTVFGDVVKFTKNSIIQLQCSRDNHAT